MRIRELRKRARITQTQLANMIGVSTQAVSNYEKGKRTIPVSLLIPIRDALNCTWEELLEERGET